MYIAMELCRPETLADRLALDYRKNNELNRIDALSIFYQIVRGLRYVHEKNMVYGLVRISFAFSLHTVFSFRFTET